MYREINVLSIVSHELTERSKYLEIIMFMYHGESMSLRGELNRHRGGEMLFPNGEIPRPSTNSFSAHDKFSPSTSAISDPAHRNQGNYRHSLRL